MKQIYATLVFAICLLFSSCTSTFSSDANPIATLSPTPPNSTKVPSTSAPTIKSLYTNLSGKSCKEIKTDIEAPID